MLTLNYPSWMAQAVPHVTGVDGGVLVYAGGDTTLTLDNDDSTGDGDIMVAAINARSTTNPTAPSGWSLQVSQTFSTFHKLLIYTKTASSEPSSWVWTWPSDNVSGAGGMVSLGRVSGYGATGTIKTGTSKTVEALSITPPAPSAFFSIMAYNGDTGIDAADVPGMEQKIFISTLGYYIDIQLDLVQPAVATGNKNRYPKDGFVSKTVDYAAVLLSVKA